MIKLIQNYFCTLKIRNAKSLFTPTRQIGKVKQSNNCDIVVSKGFISNIGNSLDEQCDRILDVDGCMITPGFIDPHTHIFIPGRSKEFAQRSVKSYQEIAKEGGGILSSVKQCKNLSSDEIYEYNKKTIERFILQGTTTLEIKSGYGLSTEEEIKLLEVINRLKINYKDRIQIISTFLGAHAFPLEYKNQKDKYVDLICQEMLPEIVKRNLADFCDVFCEEGYFSYQQSRKILKQAQSLRMKLRLHADEFLYSKGAELAVELQAFSADHLMAVSEKGIEILSQSNVITTLLPGTTVFLGKQSFAPARKLIQSGCRVALATDFNPGSSVFQSQPLMMNFAMNYYKMSLEEVFEAVTYNAGLSLDLKNVGILDKGYQADMIVWKDIDDLACIPYYNCESRYYIKYLIKKGKVFEINK